MHLTHSKSCFSFIIMTREICQLFRDDILQQYLNCINSGFSWFKGYHPITVLLQFDRGSQFIVKLTKNILSRKTIYKESTLRIKFKSTSFSMVIGLNSSDLRTKMFPIFVQ